MNRKTAALAGILALSNVLVWADRVVFDPIPRAFAFSDFSQVVVALWPESKLVDRPFEPSALIPESHLHLLSNTADEAVYSVYVGHYPHLGRTDPGPHDPRVCYGRSGYEILSGPEAIRIDSLAGRYGLQRIEVVGIDDEDQKDVFTVYYWSQFAGRMPSPAGGQPPALERLNARFEDRRTDLIWTCVGLRGSGRSLEDGLRDKFLRLMRAGAQAMGE